MILIESGSAAYEDSGQGLKQTPIAMTAGIGQVGARKVTAESQVIEARASGFEASHDIAQAFAIGELAEAQRQELIVTGQTACRAGSGELLGAAGKLGWKQGAGDLREDGCGRLHLPSVRPEEGSSSPLPRRISTHRTS